MVGAARPRYPQTQRAQLEQPPHVVDVGVEERHGDEHVRRPRELRLLLGLAPRHQAEVEEALGHLAQHPGRHDGVVGQAVGQLDGACGHRLGQLVRLGVAQVVGQHLVQDHRAQVELARRELGREELRLAHRRRLERRHHHEGGPPVRQQPRHRLGPLDEAGVHRLEQDEELRDVRQELRAEDAVGHLVEGPRRHVHQSRPVGHDEPAQQARREEVGHALRRIEEVERVARRRRVHDDEVVLALAVDLVEPLHGDVVVGLHEAARDVLVERVGEDLLPRRRVGRVGADEVVPALLGVEHGRPQLTPRPGRRPGEDIVGDADLVVPDPLQTRARRPGAAPGRP